ncbi:MAG: two-component regulator propeller domain-containing protein [Bacteroidota bacterium]
MSQITTRTLCFWLCLGPLWGLGQSPDYRFEQYDMADGLPHVAIQALHQDRFGYLWVGTWNGLSRYDGYQFVNFQPEPGDSLSISHGTIYDLAETPEGELWISTEIGLSRFEHSSQQFHNRNDSCQAFNPCAYRFAQVEADPDGQVWASSSLHRKQLIRRKAGQDWEWVSGTFRRLMATSRQLWFFSYQEAFLFSSQTNELLPALDLYPALANLSDKYLWESSVDPLERIWFATDQGMYLFDGQRLIAQPGWPEHKARALLVDSRGGVWMGTAHGLYHQPGGQTEIHHLTHQSNVPHSLSSNEINCLYEDRQGNIWVGTERGGLNKLRSSDRSPFRAVNQGAFGRALNELSVYALHKTRDGQEIWVGTNLGIFIFDAESRQLRHHLKEELPDPQVRALSEDLEGNIWVGFIQERACYLRRPSLQVVSLKEQMRSMGSVRNIQQDSSGHMWVTGRQIIRFRSPDSPSEIMADYFRFQGESLNLYIWDLRFAQNGTVWLACNRGLLAVDLERDSITQWVHLAQGKQRQSQVVFCIHEDEQGILWLGLWGGGLVRYDPKEETIQQYATSEGLEARLIYGILPDQQGWLWLSTNAGLVRFHPQEESFVNFTVEDGLVANDFDTGAFTESEDGELFFGGRNGFVSLNPKELSGDMVRFPSRVRLTEVHISGKPFSSATPIEALDTLHIRYSRAQAFEFAFSAFAFSRPGQTRYQYRLEGYEENWSIPTDQARIRYTGLEPGRYLLSIKANDANGNFGEPSLQLHLIIRPLLIQETWFRWCLALLVIGSLMGGVYWRMRSLNQRERTLLRYRAALAKQEALAAQFDHHFTFNSLNSIQRFILEQEPQAAVRYVSRFGKLIRRVMQQARETFIPLEEELETLELYLELEQSRARFPFQYQLEIDPALDRFSLELPGMLVQPFVENAIWHGLMAAERPGRLHLCFLKRQRQLTIEIEDDGIGREASGRLKARSKLTHDSRGTQLVQERIATLEALLQYPIKIHIEDLYDPIGTAAGTRIVLQLPLET